MNVYPNRHGTKGNIGFIFNNKTPWFMHAEQNIHNKLCIYMHVILFLIVILLIVYILLKCYVI